MIESAEEFVRLRSSEKPAEYLRAAMDTAPMAVGLDVIARYPEMRTWVAHNKTVPLEVLTILAHDPHSTARCWVAAKNKLSAELFDLLAQDVDESVRKRVADNKNVPAVVLEKLARDNCVWVAEAARERLRNPGASASGILDSV